MKNELRSLAVVFLRAGNLTFGGGDAITALLQRELVHRREWLTRDQYGLAQSLAKVTPGTAILAFCAATGWIVRRSAGALAAVLAVSCVRRDRDFVDDGVYVDEQQREGSGSAWRSFSGVGWLDVGLPLGFW